MDFGSIMDCDDVFLLHLRNTISAGLEQDQTALTEALVGLGCLAPDSSSEARESFSNFCMQLLEPLRPPQSLPAEFLNPAGEYCWGRSRLMQRAGKQALATIAAASSA